MARTGRPRKFDRDEALTSAMVLFWRHGFEGASLERLRQSMGGLSSASFYAAFGSKNALYREVLARYLGTHGRVLDALHDTSLPPRERIRRALRRSARMQTDSSHPPGCMVALSATVGSAELGALGALTASERFENRDAIASCVRAAVDAGELKPDADVIGLTALFDGLLCGFSIQAIDHVTTSALEAAIANALTAWASARQP